MEASSLFARLYLDKDVDVLVADLVRGQGFAAAKARSEAMRGATDAEQLAFAAEQGRVLVTHNRLDFEELAVGYYEEGRTHGGIVCAFRRPPHDLASRLVRLLNEYTAGEFENQVVYV
jgi:hypothetical protein